MKKYKGWFICLLIVFAVMSAAIAVNMIYRGAAPASLIFI